MGCAAKNQHFCTHTVKSCFYVFGLGFGFFLWMSIFYINVAVQSGLMKLMLSKDQKVQEAISKDEAECLFFFFLSLSVQLPLV